jgi:hypothetical protein
MPCCVHVIWRVTVRYVRIIHLYHSLHKKRVSVQTENAKCQTGTTERENRTVLCHKSNILHSLYDKVLKPVASAVQSEWTLHFTTQCAAERHCEVTWQEATKLWSIISSPTSRISKHMYHFFTKSPP